MSNNRMWLDLQHLTDVSVKGVIWMFLSSQGEQGERGSPGAAGSSGPDGPTGPRGDKGEPGLPGETVSNIYNTLWVECESLLFNNATH